MNQRSAAGTQKIQLEIYIYSLFKGVNKKRPTSFSRSFFNLFYFNSTIMLHFHNKYP